jgi:hypothetical protein
MPDIFRLVATAVTTTSTFNVLAFGSASTAVIRLMTICNTHTSSTANITVQVVKAASTNSPVILFAYTSVAAQQTLVPFSEPLTLEGGDRLQVVAGQTGQFHVVASALETF